MPRVMRIAIIVVGYGYKAFGATVARPSGYGYKAFGAIVIRPLGAFGGLYGQNFRVTIPGVSGVSNPGY